MKRSRNFFQNLPQRSADPEVFPVVPIVELAGCNRVLVENHLGVMEYSLEKVGIKMKYGELHICGCNLMLAHMTKVKLIVTGQIDNIALIRRSRT